jgi:hypothetical protein
LIWKLFWRGLIGRRQTDLGQREIPRVWAYNPYNALAAKLNTEVGGIVAQCKLEPKADEQLHLVIADVLSGAEAMQGKTKKVTRRSGAVGSVAVTESS